MLMLSRHAGESILIGRETVVTIAALDAANVTFDLRGRRLGGLMDGEPYERTVTLPNRAGSTLEIADNVRIEILNFSDPKLRVGVYHPKSLSVHRKEIWEEMERGRKNEKNEK